MNRRHFFAAIALLTGTAVLPTPSLSMPTQPSHYSSIGHDALFEEEKFGASEQEYDLLDSILFTAEQELKPYLEFFREKNICASPDEVIENTARVLMTIDNILLNHGLHSTERNDLLHQGLRSGAIDCDNIILLYASIAEQLDLPFKIVRLPKHTMVQIPLSDTQDLYLDPINSRAMNEIQLIEEYNITPQSIENGAYLRKLNKDEILAMENNSIGTFLLENHQIIKAIEYLTKAIITDPTDVNAYHQRGVLFEYIGNNKEALINYKQAISLDPNFTESHLGLALIYAFEGNILNASQSFERVKKLNPELAKNYTRDISIAIEMSGGEQ